MWFGNKPLSIMTLSYTHSFTHSHNLQTLISSQITSQCFNSFTPGLTFRQVKLSISFLISAAYKYLIVLV